MVLLFLKVSTIVPPMMYIPPFSVATVRWKGGIPKSIYSGILFHLMDSPCLISLIKTV